MRYGIDMKQYNKGKIHGLLLNAVKSVGSFEISEVLPYFEEQLTMPEYEACEAFLKWVVANDRTFGRNLAEVWDEWEKTLC